jgi:hypothetical protein
MHSISIRPRAWWAAALVLAAVSPATAQEPFDFYGRGPYRPAVPRPDTVLGHAAGARHTQYAEQQAVLDAMIAAVPDRVRAETIGTTEEGRAMRALIISAPANIARLEEIRSGIGALRDPRITSPAEAAAIAAREPLVVMLSYSIHGNEPAGFEAAMWVAYQLLASDEPATRTALENAVVVLNPSANPDGHERFAVWYNSVAVGTDEPFAHEWNEPWGIWGRFGHYRFDMNRDLIAVSQAPVRAMLSAILRWSPQVFVDHHSTTEQFFFPPPALPVNQNLPPHALRWLEAFGRGNAAAFDRYGWQYYTRDIFDLFYAGYFDTGPALHGATGMTYETDGGKVLARRRDDGTVITFSEGIAHHYVASLATIETAGANREQRLLDFYDFHRSTAAAGAPGLRRIVVLPDGDPTNAARLRTILGLHGVEVSRLTAPYSASAHAFADGPSGPARRHTFPPGALVIDLDQPKGRMARALLEPRAELDQDFVARQLERFERNRRRGEDASTEGYEFYDVTAWSLPFTLGLEAFWTDDLGSITAAAAQAVADDPARAVAATDAPRPGPARSAYVFPNDRLGSAALAMALTREGFVLGVSTQPLRADGRGHPRGTIVARTSRNGPALSQRIAELAARYGVPVTAVQSAFPDSGGVGVGSESVRPVFDPRILVAAGDGVTQTSYGALWHFLERELGEPFVPVRLGSVARMYTLSDYNVLVIPDGNAGTIRRELGEAGIARLERWLRDGGVLIVYGGAALVPGHEDLGLSTVKAVGDEDEDENGDDDGPDLPNDPALTPPLASPTAEPDAPAPLPGTIFRATLDHSHWLTLGYEQAALPVMLSGGTLLAPSEGGDNPVAFVGDSLLLAGWTWPDNTLRHLDGSVWAAVESVGRGNVVMLAEDPLFRAFWRGPARLLTNAMLFGAGR